MPHDVVTMVSTPGTIAAVIGANTGVGMFDGTIAAASGAPAFAVLDTASSVANTRKRPP